MIDFTFLQKRSINYLKVVIIIFIFYRKESQVENLKVLMYDFIFYRKDQ